MIYIKEKCVKLLYSDYLKYIEANPQQPNKPGKQKKGEELKADKQKEQGKKKGCC